MKKKLMLILLALTLAISAFALVGCGGPGNNTTQVSLLGYTVKDDAVFGKIYTKSFPNSQIVYSVYNDVVVGEGSTWTLSVDIFGNETIESKTIPLIEGDNQYYILVKNSKGEVKQYVIIARRRPIYTVSFNTAGGSAIATQYIEEDSNAVEPATIPTRVGYTFDGWNYNFNNPIKESRTITASWTAKTYTVTFNSNGGSSVANKTATYGQAFTLPTTTRTGYTFDGWYYNGTKITSGNLWQIHENDLAVELTARWTAIFTYSNNKITGLTDYGKTLTEIVIPDQIDGVSITSIGSDAFYNCSSLTSITIPNSVTSIGDYAFHYCTNLTRITIGNSVTSIGDYAFKYCSSLTSITIPNSVTSIGSYAFYGCSSLKSVTIPNSVTSIGDRAFYNCYRLTSITIGNSVTSIGSSAFESCVNLTSITVDSSNPNYSSIDGNLYNKEKTTLIQYAKGKSATTFTIPNSVTSIGSGAFYNCSSLTSITIGNSVTSIGYDAFYNCSSLTSITIPNSVTSIGSSAFYGCSRLTSITIPNSVTSIGGWAFSYCSSLTIYCEATSKSSGWSSYWNDSDCPVVWGHKG